MIPTRLMNQNEFLPRTLGPSTPDSTSDGDEGMSTAEYAIGTIAAAALAGVLYVVVTGDSVTSLLTSVIESALAVDL